MKPLVSIIIPAYNEEPRLPKTLERVAAFLKTQTFEYEVLVVENGSRDRTLAIAEEFSKDNPRFQALHSRQIGKGRAVRLGMWESQGQYRFMCDADLSMPIEELPRFLPPAIENPKIVIASREAPGAVRYNEPNYRHFGGRGVNLLIRWFALPKLWDTQCGFKLFREDIAEDLFSQQTLMGFSFDVELLYLARQRGYEIVELPIPWYFSPESKVSPIRDGIQLFFDILKIRKNHRQGLYAKKV
jgi:glycosyltransferase involved in cell wall biosynthesis